MSEITFKEAAIRFFKYYANRKWSYTTIEYALSRTEKHIYPFLGDLLLTSITAELLDQFYLNRLDAGCSERVVKEIHKIINGVFREAVKRRMIENNPCDTITLPKVAYSERDIWDAETFLRACDLCNDKLLLLSMHLAFGCTLRIAEILGLQWDRVFLDSKEPYIYIDRIIERVKTDIIIEKHHREILLEFPNINKSSTTVVLKTPKTQSSKRRVYLPQTIVKLLNERKEEVEHNRIRLGKEYHDYNLVFCFENGNPVEKRIISDRFAKLINDNNLPKVVFHSLRHTSITYKLKITNGDIKAVQGDSGHTSAKMVSDIYSHILDSERSKTALLVEKNFYNISNNEIINNESLDDKNRIKEIIELLSELL